MRETSYIRKTIGMKVIFLTAFNLPGRGRNRPAVAELPAADAIIGLVSLTMVKIDDIKERKLKQTLQCREQ